jgi:hypothetical protein
MAKAGTQVKAWAGVGGVVASVHLLRSGTVIALPDGRPVFLVVWMEAK